MSQKDTHELQYQSGQMTSWNKFCFTGGYIEVNVSLPGLSDVRYVLFRCIMAHPSLKQMLLLNSGFWPAV